MGNGYHRLNKTKNVKERMAKRAWNKMGEGGRLKRKEEKDERQKEK